MYRWQPLDKDRLEEINNLNKFNWYPVERVCFGVKRVLFRIKDVQIKDAWKQAVLAILF